MKTLNLGWAVLLACAVGCGGPVEPVNADGGSGTSRPDAGGTNTGEDAGASSGEDAGSGGTGDAGTGPDAGVPPGPDAGVPPADAGTGGGQDAGSAPDAGCDLTSCGGSPDVAGARTVQVSTASLSEPKGTVALKVYTPAGVTGAPVIVVHPGFQLAGDQYTSYAQHLASRGYVVVVTTPPYGGLFSPTSHAELATYLGHVLDWVVQQAGSGTLAGVADPSRIGLAGHSLGGKLSLLVASSDARPKAVFALDPVDSGSPLSSDPVAYPSVAPQKMGSITVPLGLIGETTNATGGFQPCAPSGENFQAYASSAVSPTVVQEMVGANHVSFLDNPACGFTCSACAAGTDVPATTRRLSRRAMTAFFDLTLRGDTAARGWLAGTQVQPDVTAGLVVVQVLNGF
ncbi:MAG: dienelactone hydrolase family protein [Deltaproteobacteria bacterium]|nr:dienelactone hydrolase family protein [Deltaproteobacteria bacterium]